ncbi:MAG: hypothetical protein ACOYNC_18785 [Bacteroidales bacterium]
MNHPNENENSRIDDRAELLRIKKEENEVIKRRWSDNLIREYSMKLPGNQPVPDENNSGNANNK